MIYELRMYDFRPGDLQRYLGIFELAGVQLISSHLELLGYFVAETGQLNRAFHLWRHNSLPARSSHRAKLMQDPNWASKFLPNGLDLIANQATELMMLLDSSLAPEHHSAPGASSRTFVWRTVELPACSAANEKSYLSPFLQESEGASVVAAWRSITGKIGRYRILTAFEDEAALDGHFATIDATSNRALGPGVGLAPRQTVEVFKAASISPMR